MAKESLENSEVAKVSEVASLSLQGNYLSGTHFQISLLAHVSTQ